MGKEKPGFLTPKAIANRIKSKGMQKLRWYCQMCEKQCRDEVKLGLKGSSVFSTHPFYYLSTMGPTKWMYLGTQNILALYWEILHFYIIKFLRSNLTI